MNNRGEIVGFLTGADPAGSSHAVRWDRHGRPTDLGTLDNGSGSRALAINDHGLVIGQSGTPDRPFAQAVRWDRRGTSASSRVTLTPAWRPPSTERARSWDTPSRSIPGIRRCCGPVTNESSFLLSPAAMKVVWPLTSTNEAPSSASTRRRSSTTTPYSGGAETAISPGAPAPAGRVPGRLIDSTVRRPGGRVRSRSRIRDQQPSEGSPRPGGVTSDSTQWAFVADSAAGDEVDALLGRMHASTGQLVDSELEEDRSRALRPGCCPGASIRIASAEIMRSSPTTKTLQPRGRYSSVGRSRRPLFA